jgi:glycosyltransferase involved in cell wall biosynthesis
MTAGAVVRIGVVMPLAEQRGGAERALVHFLDGLAPGSNALVSLCFLEPGPLVEWARQRGYAVEVMQAGRLRHLSQWGRAVRRVYEWLRRNEIGVVLSWMAKAHLYAGPAAWYARIPALWWQHGVPVRGGLDSLVSFVPAKRILACSQAAVRAQRRLSGRRAELVTVYPGVDLERMHRAEQARVGRRALGLPEDMLVIGIVARLERWKGIDVLLRALAQLLPEYPSVHLVVVGGPHPLEPDYAEEVRRLATELGLREQSTFCGHQDDAPKWMCEMDIVVNASFGEPFGMVIVEAMALGKAVVATDSGGAPEIVTHEVNGLLVAPGQVAGLAQALSRLLASRELRRRLGEAARQRATHFSAPRFVAEVLAAVREGSP